MYQTHLERLSRTRLDDLLLDEGVIERARVEDAQAEQELTGRALSSILLERDQLDEWDLAKLVSMHYGLPFLDMSDLSASLDIEEVMPLEFCHEHTIVPLDKFGSTFTLGVCEMPSAELIDKIIEVSGMTPFLYVVVRRQINDALNEEAKRRKKTLGSKQPAAAASSEGSSSSSAPSVSDSQSSMSMHEAAEALQAFAQQEARGDGTCIPTGGLPVVSWKLDASVQIRSRTVEKPAAPRAPVEAPAAPAAPAAVNRSWESIFDMGDDAVQGD